MISDVDAQTEISFDLFATQQKKNSNDFHFIAMDQEFAEDTWQMVSKPSSEAQQEIRAVQNQQK